MVELHPGLEDVVVRESRIGEVDGENGDLWYAGYHIDDLVEHASYEEVLHLLLHQELPTHSQLTGLQDELVKHRQLPEQAAALIEATPDADPMDMLRTLVSLQAAFDDDPNYLERPREKAVRLAAKFPTIIAAHCRARKGKDPVPPEDDLSHAANFLYMLHEEEPTEQAAAAMDAALILYAEHGMNASTFAGTVTASTLANLYSSITSAIGALQGPLHGGATETVMEMIEAVGGPDEAEDWVQQQLDAKEKIPGFGHRVYQVTDPRCHHFLHHITELKSGEDEEWVQTIDAIRSAVEDWLAEKDIWPNTDLYSGTLYRLLDIPPDFYTAIFATARVAGWSAHIIEQVADNRILRPRIEYVGDTGGDWIPIEDR